MLLRASVDDLATGQPVDIDDPLFVIRDPLGYEFEMMGGRVSAGRYQTSIAPVEAGVWRVQFRSVFYRGLYSEDAFIVDTGGVSRRDDPYPDFVIVDDNGNLLFSMDGAAVTPDPL